MYIDLSGEWKIWLEADQGPQEGTIRLPGILQAQGYGNPVTEGTPWVSSLHDPFWYEREEYRFGQEKGVKVPFLCQPPRHFLGQAVYERKFMVPKEGAFGKCCFREEGDSFRKWHFYVELARWRSQVWIDGQKRGEDCTLCGPHDIALGRLEPGEHTIRVVLDNSMQYPYRPDAHGVSDALGATWNGMAGEMALITEDVLLERREERKRYAQEHPRTAEARDGRFFLDGEPFYFRGTHFGGEYPLTGYPETDRAWWDRIMGIVGEWGLNGIRFHSYCPPEAAFAAADRAGVALLVECGMWNHFEDSAAGEEMLAVLGRESRRILEYFGHHPSFVLFSPSNEPGGAWYRPLRRWVEETAAYDKALGYEGRRLYTAQSGWFYDVPPEKIQGVDFIYFHRSGYGPYMGGTIRNPKGWRGGDYSPSLKGASKPVICHELGQICAYPDYSVIDKFKGYLKPGNYEVFCGNARANGVLPYADDFVKCSGENQIRLYKEELEANFRTPQLQGFELLDLHDYLGQGTALVGILDAFWETKGYGEPEEFRNFCGDTVLLARCAGYVWKNTDRPVIPVEVCHYGKEDLEKGVILWRLCREEEVLQSGRLRPEKILRGGNTEAGSIALDFGEIRENVKLRLELELVRGTDSPTAQGELPQGENAVEAAGAETGNVISHNKWPLYVFGEQGAEEKKTDKTASESLEPSEPLEPSGQGFLYTRDWKEAKAALKAGGRVIYSPWLSELNYECPALSGRSVGWNSQMGPTWCRTMGIVVQEEHPVFRHFPTGRSGGWQWEDILRNARGFHMEGMEGVRPIVQPIDDWNRNLLQSLIFEANVLGGRLLLVSANLEGSFEERPAAYSLKQAIFRYAASEEFDPEDNVVPETIEAKLFPMLRMRELVREILYDGVSWEEAADNGGAGKTAPGFDAESRDGTRVSRGWALVEADPSLSTRVEKAKFPIEIQINFHQAFSMEGILYVPEQRDRNHEGFAKDCRLEVRGTDGQWQTVWEGRFENSCRSQRVLFEEILGDAIRIIILSAYGAVDKYVWEEGSEGWFQVFRPGRAALQIGGLHVVCRKEASCSDSYSCGKNVKSRTKEIEL